MNPLTNPSIIQVKLTNPEPCHKFEPVKEILNNAKLINTDSTHIDLIIKYYN